LTAVGAGGYNRVIGHGRDGTEVFRWLSVGHLDAVDTVDTREVLRFAIAGFEDIVLGIVGSIISAANTIEDMFAVMSSIGTSRVTSLETERVATDKVVPFNHLSVRVVATAKCVAVNESTQWVAPEICAMGIQFTSPVTSGNVELGLINETDNLDIIGRFHELKTCQCALGYQAGTVARLGAPRNHLSFMATNVRIGFSSAPQAKVVEAVEQESLAKRLLVFGGRIANIITDLMPTDKIGLGIGLVRETAGIGKMFGCKGSCWECLRTTSGRCCGRCCRGWWGWSGWRRGVLSKDHGEGGSENR